MKPQDSIPAIAMAAFTAAAVAACAHVAPFGEGEIPARVLDFQEDIESGTIRWPDLGDFIPDPLTPSGELLIRSAAHEYAMRRRLSDSDIDLLVSSMKEKRRAIPECVSYLTDHAETEHATRLAEAREQVPSSCGSVAYLVHGEHR